MTPDELRAEFVVRLDALVEEFAGMIPGLELPVVADWVTVIAVDDATNGEAGTLWSFYRRNQWKYRTVGLLVAAGDQCRRTSLE